MTTRNANETLQLALLTLATEGRRTRCSDPGDREKWFSDLPTERAQAARWCAGCPVLDQCGAAAEANHERHGVWAGQDRTLKPRKAKAA